MVNRVPAAHDWRLVEQILSVSWDLPEPDRDHFFERCSRGDQWLLLQLRRFADTREIPAPDTLPAQPKHGNAPARNWRKLMAAAVLAATVGLTGLSLTGAPSGQARHASVWSYFPTIPALTQNTSPKGIALLEAARLAEQSGAPLHEIEEFYSEALNSPASGFKSRSWSEAVKASIAASRYQQGDFSGGDHLLQSASQDPRTATTEALGALALGARLRGNYGLAAFYLDRSVAALPQPGTPYGWAALDYAAAEALIGRRACLDIERFTRILPREAPAQRIRHSFSSALIAAGNADWTQAEQLLREAIVISERDLAAQPATRVELYYHLARVLAASGRSVESDQVAGQALDLARSSYGLLFADHPLVARLRALVLEP